MESDHQIEAQEACKQIGEAYVAIRNGNATIAVNFIILATKTSPGCELASAFLMIMFHCGHGVAKDVCKAKKMASDPSSAIIPWLHAACTAGKADESFPYSQYLMESLRVAGLVIIDAALSMLYPAMAADAKYPPAIHALATRYERGGYGIEKDAKRAYELYKGAECADYIPSLIAQRNCYEHGIGTKKSDEEFVKINRQLVFLNDIQAIAVQGDMYRLGKRVEQSLVEAVRLYQHGASYNDKGCQRMLGYCYLNGTGVDADLTQAQCWLEKAVEQRDGIAMIYLAQVQIKRDKPSGKKAQILSLLLHPSTTSLTSSLASLRLSILGKAYLHFADSNGNADGDEQQALIWYSHALRAGAPLDAQALVIRLFRLACSYNYSSLTHLLLDRGASSSSLATNIERSNYFMAIAERGASVVFDPDCDRSKGFPISICIELESKPTLLVDEVIKAAIYGNNIRCFRFFLTQGLFIPLCAISI